MKFCFSESWLGSQASNTGRTDTFFFFSGWKEERRVSGAAGDVLNRTGVETAEHAATKKVRVRVGERGSDASEVSTSDT